MVRSRAAIDSAAFRVGGFDRVAELAQFIDEHGELGGALLSHFCGNLDQAREAREDHYCGEYASLADFAQEITEETTEIPPALAYYIDYKAMARDMELNGDVFTVETEGCRIYVF